jgi:HK97 family phage prohead protease
MKAEGNAMQTKRMIAGHVITTKESERNGVKIGIVEGYLATWDIDRAGDRFERGAFAESIKKLQDEGRQLRLKDQHWRTIGGFPADTLREDDRGLYGVGEINLEVAQGNDAYVLAKQDVLVDFSVGFSFGRDDVDFEQSIRVFKRVRLWECSIVDEPMNPKANIMDVKALSNLPVEIAPIDTPFEPAAAGLKMEAKSFDMAFVYPDGETPALPVVDVVDDRPMIIPRAVFQARADVDAGFGVPADPETRAELELRVDDLYERLGMDPPFASGAPYSTAEISGLRKQSVSRIIRSGKLSRKAADLLADLVDSRSRNAGDHDARNELEELRDIIRRF